MWIGRMRNNIALHSSRLLRISSLLHFPFFFFLPFFSLRIVVAHNLSINVIPAGGVIQYVSQLDQTLICLHGLRDCRLVDVGDSQYRPNGETHFLCM